MICVCVRVSFPPLLEVFGTENEQCAPTLLASIRRWFDVNVHIRKIDDQGYESQTNQFHSRNNLFALFINLSNKTNAI